MNQLVGGLILAAVLYALLAFAANRMVYFPMKYPAGDWSAGERIGATEVFIREGLHAWYVPRPDSEIATLHLHGNAGNITHRVLTARHIVEAGSAVLLLDYRGYGRSTGWPTEHGLYEDATAAWDWLSSRHHERIVVHGESLGTAVAAELATRRKCAGVILEAPFTSARDVASRVLPLLGGLLVWGYDTRSRMARINAPLLMIHGDRDEVIAYEFGEELYRAAAGPKSFWTIRGATHNDLHIVADREFSARLRAFYASLK
jgi:fermentation-respiration switch protein FrsA (DUF1100 family)